MRCAVRCDNTLHPMEKVVSLNVLRKLHILMVHLINNTRELLIQHLEDNHIEASDNRVNVIMDFIDNAFIKKKMYKNS